MAINTEIKDIMSKEGVLFDVAEKIEYKRELNAEEKEIAEISDAWDNYRTVKKLVKLVRIQIVPLQSSLIEL